MSTYKALCVGVDKYANPRYNLNGCVMDAAIMSGILQDHYDFSGDDVRLLINERATKQGIMDRLGWLCSDTSSGDVLVFFYAGHGSQVRDRNGDELEDHLDEILCPHDLNWSDPLTDDILNMYFKKVNKDVNLTVIFDCCHSGTATRSLSREEKSPLHKDYKATRYIAPPLDIQHRSRGLGWLFGTKEYKQIGVSLIDEHHVFMSGCNSQQEAQEKRFGNEVRGAFSYSLVKSLKRSNWRLTYREAHKQTSKRLKDDDFWQNPQLESHEDLIDLEIFTNPPF